MTKKTLGFVELEWTCPNCGNKNPGLKKTCGSCGNPQSDKVSFELGEKRDLISDDKKISSAVKAADIHCPFCGTRNYSDALVCTQCGGNLKEGLKRESGRVINAAPVAAANPIKCPGCGTMNPAGSSNCSACGAQIGQNQVNSSPGSTLPAKPSAIRPWMALPVIALLITVCGIIGYLLFHTTATTGVVQGTQWQRSIAIEMQGDVVREAWRDELPADARNVSCSQAYRSRQDSPAPNSKEVCATQLVDQGNGSAKVEETCYYEIYADYCKYNALEWKVADHAVAEGTDLQPYWPDLHLSSGQREGERTETFTIDFETKDGNKQYTSSDFNLYPKFSIGSNWSLSINSLGTIVEVSP